MTKEKIEIDFMIEMRGSNKYLILNLENICRLLREHPLFAGRFKYDLFSNISEIKVKGNWEPFEDKHALEIQTAVQQTYKDFAKTSKDMIWGAIEKVTRENEYDSAIEYLTSTEWDKTPRLDTWLTSVYGVEDNIYHKAVGSNWMKGLVQRLVYPGCKFDYVLVLEGPQGSKKSTSLGELGGTWHVETTMSTDSKDFFMQFFKKAIVEFSEGETLSRTEVKRMKAIITTQVDTYRLPYSRTVRDFPRRCVFAMTTNQSEYLKDETGNRRWLPVTVLKEEADIKWLRKNRDQLFAEAYHRVVIDKEKSYEFPKKETEEQQKARNITDPNLELVSNWYWSQLSSTAREDGITSHMAFSGGVHSGNTMHSPMKKHEEMIMGGLLINEMKLEKKRTTVNGIRTWRYFPPLDSVDTVVQKNMEDVFEEDF